MMAMTTAEVDLLRTSLRRATRRKREIADIFYDTLFQIAPDTRSLFGLDIVGQTEKTMLALGAIVAQIHDIAVFGPMVSALAKRHVAYGVREEHYGSVLEALIATFKAVFGDEFSAEDEAVWRLAYATMAQVMIEAAYHSAEPPPSTLAIAS